MNFVNAFKRGDLFWSAQFLKRLGGEHTFYCREDFSGHLPDILEGTQITLAPLQDHPPNCMDLWIGSGSNAVNWYSEGCPNDVIGFLMKFFNSLGFGEVFTERQQFLASYRALRPNHPDGNPGILAIDCDPQSSQCPHYVPDEFAGLIRRLRDRHKVTTVGDGRYSFSEIGQLSRAAELIIGVATGPIFPTFNFWNKETPRFLFLDPLKLDYGIPARVEHHGHVRGMTIALEDAGWL